MNYCLRNGFLLQQRQQSKFNILNKKSQSLLFTSNGTTTTTFLFPMGTKEKHPTNCPKRGTNRDLSDKEMMNSVSMDNIDMDRLQLRNLCISIEKIVQDVERDNIGNRWNSLYLINGFVHNFEYLNMKHNQIKINNVIPDTLIDIIFKYYYVSQQMIIDETLFKIDIGLKVVKIYDDYDDKKWIDPSNKSLIKKRATLNPKYKKNLKQLKVRLKWCQIW